MYLPYCVPIHWGRGELEMSALDIHSIHRLFWKYCKLHLLSWFLWFCYFVYFYFYFFDIWLIPAELGQFLVGLREAAILRHGLPSI